MLWCCADFAGKMVHTLQNQNDEEQQKNVIAVNGFTNGGTKATLYRLDTIARAEIRRYQSTNQGESQNVNRPDAIQLGRRIRGERV